MQIFNLQTWNFWGWTLEINTCQSSSPNDSEAHRFEHHQHEWILNPNPAGKPLCLPILHTTQELAKQIKQLLQVYHTSDLELVTSRHYVPQPEEPCQRYIHYQLHSFQHNFLVDITQQYLQRLHALQRHLLVGYQHIRCQIPSDGA